MLEDVSLCSISMSVSHVPGNQGGFLQRRNCHCSGYSRNRCSYVLEKPRNITHYLTLEEVGNCDRSVTNFFHMVCFDLWSSSEEYRWDMPPDTRSPSCASPLLCGAVLHPINKPSLVPDCILQQVRTTTETRHSRDPPPMRVVLTLSWSQPRLSRMFPFKARVMRNEK